MTATITRGDAPTWMDGSGYGDGSGSGYGDGSGYGYGDGSGYGYGKQLGAPVPIGGRPIDRHW